MKFSDEMNSPQQHPALANQISNTIRPKSSIPTILVNNEKGRLSQNFINSELSPLLMDRQCTAFQLNINVRILPADQYSLQQLLPNSRCATYFPCNSGIHQNYSGTFSIMQEPVRPIISRLVSPLVPLAAMQPSPYYIAAPIHTSSCSMCCQITRFDSIASQNSDQKHNLFCQQCSFSSSLQPQFYQSVNYAQPVQALPDKTQNYRKWSEVISESPSHQQSADAGEFLNNESLSNLSGQSLKFRNPKIRYFRMSFNLLNKLFTNSQIDTHDLELHDMEKLLLMHVFRRKFPSLSIPVVKDRPFSHEYFCTLVQKCKVELSNKRIEENIKFIFKHTMKYLKDRFRNRDTRLQSPEHSDHFYHHYFLEVVEYTEMPIEAFRDPLNSKRPKNKALPKTLNSDYMHLLFRSVSFARDFKQYLASNQLIEDYVKSIPNKFEKILIKWERCWEDRIDKRIFKEKLNDYFFKNKQCKLPWTVNEIISAVSHYLNMLRNMDSNNK